MNIGRGIGATMALVCALLGWEARYARAAVRLVDGACPTSGTGTQLACGPSGPFRTIQEGVNAMLPGDTVSVRGGIYQEHVVVQRACTATAPCVLAPYGSERPILRGMLQRADWSPASGASGVWTRTMEATPDELTKQQPDAYHPMTLYQNTGASVLTPLGYDGDNVTAPRDGHYSYHASTHRLYVNPIGTADPATSIYVPHLTILVEFESPAAYVTLRGFAIEGVRGILIESVNTGYPLQGITIEQNEVRYFPDFGIHVNGAPGVVIRNNVVEYGGRGLGGYAGSAYGAYGMRLFAIHGAVITGNVIGHLGHGACAWCDPPWDDNDHSRLDEYVYANAIDFKQTEGGTIADNIVTDVADWGIALDVSRGVTLSRNRVERARIAFLTRTQTPVPGSTACADNLFTDNVVTQSQVGVTVEDDGLLRGARYLARIERTSITSTPTRYDVPLRSYVIIIEDAATAPTERYLHGAKLLLRDDVFEPARRRFVFRSQDAADLVLADGGDSSVILTEGGSLRVVGIGGDAFDAEYALAAEDWSLLSDADPAAGVVYANPAGPISKIVFRANGSLRITGRGEELKQSLGTEPLLVQIELRLGAYRYCAEFGGSVQRFTMGERLLRRDAVSPAACPAPLS